MNTIQGINNKNYIEKLLSEKYFHLKLTNCQPWITLGRNIIRKLVLKLEGNAISSTDYFDIF